MQIVSHVYKSIWYRLIRQVTAGCVPNGVDPEQTPRFAASDQDLQFSFYQSSLSQYSG